MADPQAATATQLRNIETKTGKSLAELRAVVAQSGLTKVGEVRAMLIERFGLGYGDANALALASKAPAVSAASDDPLTATYSGAKAALRPLHEQVMSRSTASVRSRSRRRSPTSAYGARSSSRCSARPRKRRSNSG